MFSDWVIKGQLQQYVFQQSMMIFLLSVISLLDEMQHLSIE
jgi:hypothetical protein